MCTVLPLRPITYTAHAQRSLSHHLFHIIFGWNTNKYIDCIFIFSPRLHQTRNILWLGVAISNVLVLFQHLLEFYPNHFQSKTAKKIFNLVIGLPYGSLALNLFSLAHRPWHKYRVLCMVQAEGDNQFDCLRSNRLVLHHLRPLERPICIWNLSMFTSNNYHGTKALQCHYILHFITMCIWSNILKYSSCTPGDLWCCIPSPTQFSFLCGALTCHEL